MRYMRRGRLIEIWSQYSSFKMALESEDMCQEARRISGPQKNDDKEKCLVGKDNSQPAIVAKPEHLQ